jgi:hypothetical protein
MKTKLIFGMFAVTMLLLAFAVAPVAATKTDEKNKNVNFVDFIQKDISGWLRPLPGVDVFEASGRLIYKDGPKKSKFVFEAEGLVKKTEYTLISYAEPWGSDMNYIIGSEFTNKKGDLKISGGWNESKLVCNNYDVLNRWGYTEGVSAAIWLVPSSDLSTPNGVFDYDYNCYTQPGRCMFGTTAIPCEL